jgi:alpha-glucoside transport system substrate-binding protein
VLSTRLQASNPPDLVILPNPGKMQQLANKGVLIRLDTFLDMHQINRDYAASWVDLGSYDNKLYALAYKVTNKGTIWYNPTQFTALGVHPPHSWSDLLALSERIASSGKYPWAMGVESGAASGWPATDWIGEIYLKQSGPDLYDQWVAHKIPWTHASIKSAFQLFGQIVGGPHYIADVPQSVLSTGFQQASYEILNTPPQAYMYYLGDFTADLLVSQFPDALPAITFDFFPFPQIAPQYQDAVTGGADLVVAMRDSSAVRELVRYLATARAQTIWVKRGGFTSANKSVDLAAYPNPVARHSAAMLTATTTFRFGAGDLLSPAVQQAFWKGALTFIRDQKQLEMLLTDIEHVAQQASLVSGSH